jgi:hypothetical protein
LNVKVEGMVKEEKPEERFTTPREGIWKRM